MAMTFPFFGPLAQRSGVMPVAVGGRLDGTIGDSTTTLFSLGSYPARAYISKFVVSQQVLATSGSALTFVVQKYDASATAAVVLTAPVNMLTAAQVLRKGGSIPLLSTLTQAQKTLDAGDTLEVLVTAAGAVSGQPTNFVVVGELLVAE